MMNPTETGNTLANRKSRLLRDGVVCRNGIAQARESVMRGLRPAELADSAIAAASDRLHWMLSANGGRIRVLAPFAVATFSWLARRSLLTPALGAGLLVAAAVVLVKRRRSRLQATLSRD